MKHHAIWIEIGANKDKILDADLFRLNMKKASQSGINEIILSVKDTSGFVLYPSTIAPHYSLFDQDFQNIDYVKQCFDIIHEQNMKAYASFDVFTEGNKENQSKYMKGLNPDWACVCYGLDEAGKPVLRSSLDYRKLETVGSIDDFGEIFVNPANPNVRNYELSLIKEFVQNYQPDGIVLDRVRYVGLSTDFSDLTREQFSAFIGHPITNWPQDIYTIHSYGIHKKELYDQFYHYRASIIKSFIQDVKEMIQTVSPDTMFGDYAGSWHPLYDRVGADWSDGKYGYASYVDTLYSGWYYPEVYIDEVKDHKPYWYSVEGSNYLSKSVIHNATHLVGSLFLEQYKDHPEKFIQAVSYCEDHSEGYMLFDLTYVDQYDWWHIANPSTFFKPITQDDEEELRSIINDSLSNEYHLTHKQFLHNAYEDNTVDDLSTKLVIHGKTIGFCIVKIENDQAWISLFAVRKSYQNKGYGKMILDHIECGLRHKNIHHITIGQEYHNFYSGIPDPTDYKLNFFKQRGYIINQDEHYDLLGKSHHPSIKNYDTSSFDDYDVSTLNEEEIDDVDNFLLKEFPGRWVETYKDLLANHKPYEEIMVLHHNGDVSGFCMISKDGTDGGLGPIGISEEERGHDVGRYLLQQSLLQLESLGVEDIIIDWTILKDYYGFFGFQPVRTYRGCTKELDHEDRHITIG